jgi:acyl-CoA dehydrogenase
MKYGLSTQQQMIYKTVQTMLENLIPSDKFRSILETEDFSRSAWKRLAEDGWLRMFSESTENKGEDFSLTDMLCISESIGSKLYPGPYSLVAAYIAPILSKLLPKNVHYRWVEPVINGEKLITTIIPRAQSNSRGEISINWGDIEVSEESEYIILNGQYKHVTFGQFADQILLPVKNNLGGISLTIIEKESLGLLIIPEKSLDLSKRSATVKLDYVRVPKKAFIGGWNADYSQEIKKHLAYYILCLNSEMIGGAQKVLDKTLTYVKERKQFGQPIAVFQVIKHKLADMFTEIENAKTYNFYTSWALLNESSGSFNKVISSRIYTTEIFKNICEKAIQLQGGMGFTWEQEIHFWYKSALYHQNHISSVRTLKRYLFNHL